MKIPIHRLVLRPLGLWRHKPTPKHYLGFTTFATRLIELDPRVNTIPLARVYLHELIHLTHQSWSEAKVLREERRRWRKLRWQDKARLYQALGKAKIGRE